MKKFCNIRFEKAVSEALELPWDSYSGINYDENLYRESIPAWNKEIGSPWNRGRPAWNKGLKHEYKARPKSKLLTGRKSSKNKGQWICGEYGSFESLTVAAKIVGKAPSTISAWCYDPNKIGWELKPW